MGQVNYSIIRNYGDCLEVTLLWQLNAERIISFSIKRIKNVFPNKDIFLMDIHSHTVYKHTCTGYSFSYYNKFCHN